MLLFAGGMIRSGSTLQYNLARHVAIASGGGYFQANAVTRDKIKQKLYHDQWYVNKSHVFPKFLGEECTKDGSLRVAMVYRDLRDVLVSTMRFRQHSFDNVFPKLRREAVAGEQGWLDNLPPEVIHRVAYEKMITDLEAEVVNIASLIDFDNITSTQVKKIASDYSLNKVRKFVKKLANWEARSRFAPGHIGGVAHGQYKLVLTREQVKMVEDEFGDWLVANGYELEF